LAVEQDSPRILDMAHLPTPAPPGFDALSKREQFEYAQALWDYVTDAPEDVPVPDSHDRVVRERLAAYRATPEKGAPWEEVKQRLIKRLEQR
jgi:putative addiction module component (TIGR02574 family)